MADEEKRENNADISVEKPEAPELSASVPFLKKLDNFWYHNKWKTIIALILAAVILICSFQMCTKVDYDAYILYAGNQYIHSSSLTDMGNGIKTICSGDRDTSDMNVSVKNLYILSQDEMEQMVSEGKEPGYALISENLSAYDNYLQFDESYYIFIISPYLFERSKIDGQYVFADMSAYAGDSDIEYVKNPDGTDNHFGVLLSSTGLGKLPVFSDMPDDTIITLRRHSISGVLFGGSSSEEYYRECEELMTKILSYKG